MYTEPLVTIQLKEYQELKAIQKEQSKPELKSIFRKAIEDILINLRHRHLYEQLDFITSILKSNGITISENAITREIKIFFADGD